MNLSVLFKLVVNGIRWNVDVSFLLVVELSHSSDVFSSPAQEDRHSHTDQNNHHTDHKSSHIEVT